MYLPYRRIIGRVTLSRQESAPVFNRPTNLHTYCKRGSIVSSFTHCCFYSVFQCICSLACHVNLIHNQLQWLNLPFQYQGWKWQKLHTCKQRCGSYFESVVLQAINYFTLWRSWTTAKLPYPTLLNWSVLEKVDQLVFFTDSEWSLVQLKSYANP